MQTHGIMRQMGFSYILPRVKDPDWFRYSNGESPKSVGNACEAYGGTPKIRCPQKTYGFVNKMIIRSLTSKKLLVCKQMIFVSKTIIGCNPSMTVYHTWASHRVVGVSKDSGMKGVGKDSSMVHEWVSSHFIA